MSAGFHALVSGLAAAPPSRLALADLHGELDAARLGALVLRLAKWLQDSDIRVAASCLDNGRHALILDLALHCAGRAHLPLPPYFTPAQRDHALEEAGADCLLADPRLPMPSGWQRSRPADGLESLTLWRRPTASSRLPSGCSVVTYTSGSTGTPQGVCLDADSLLRTAAALQAAFSSIPLQRHLCALPLSTLLESVGVYAALARGCSVHLPPLASLGYSGASALDGGAFYQVLQTIRPDSLILVPQLLSAWIAQIAAHPASAHRANLVAVGGAKVPACLLEQADSLGLPVFEGYGLSEAGSVVALNTPGARRAGSVGRPLPHIQLRIEDDGEIWLRGQSPLPRADHAPLIDADGWWPSGDLGELDAEGFLHLNGRKRNVFITAFGRNVSPEWIESALQGLPGVQQLLVYGEALAENLAIVSGDPAIYAGNQGAQQLALINQTLPDYARVTQLVWTPEPWTAGNGLLTGNGRPRREVILERFAPRIPQQPAAPPAACTPHRPHSLPQGATA